MSFLQKNLTVVLNALYQPIGYTSIQKALISLNSESGGQSTAAEAMDIDYEEMSEEEMVNKFLKIFLVNLTNSKNEVMNKILTTDIIEQMFGLSGDKDKFFRKYVTYTTKFLYNYDAFFKNEEKYFHRVANEMIKKLAKLYATAKI